MTIWARTHTRTYAHSHEKIPHFKGALAAASGAKSASTAGKREQAGKQADTSRRSWVERRRLPQLRVITFRYHPTYGTGLLNTISMMAPTRLVVFPILSYLPTVLFQIPSGASLTLQSPSCSCKIPNSATPGPNGFNPPLLFPAQKQNEREREREREK